MKDKKYDEWAWDFMAEIPNWVKTRQKWAKRAFREGKKEYIDQERAVSCLTVAVLLAPRKTSYRLARAEQFELIKEYHLALADIMEAYAISPSKKILSRCFDIRSRMHEEDRRMEQALSDCNEALKLTPDETYLHLYRDSLITEINRPQEEKGLSVEELSQ